MPFRLIHFRFRFYLIYALIARPVPHADGHIAYSIWTVFQPLRLTCRALLLQVQFASHSQPANYISWADPSEFESDAGALISLLFFYHLRVFHVVITLSADSPCASRLHAAVLPHKFHIRVIRVQELLLCQHASFGAILGGSQDRY